jgi:hypothetical protein
MAREPRKQMLGTHGTRSHLGGQNMPQVNRRTGPTTPDRAPEVAPGRSRARTCLTRLVRVRTYRRLALVALGALVVLGGVAIAAPTGDFVSSTGATGGLVKAGPVSPANGFPPGTATPRASSSRAA